MNIDSEERVSSLAKHLASVLKLVALCTVNKGFAISTAPALRSLRDASRCIRKHGFDWTSERYEARGALNLRLILNREYCPFNQFDRLCTASELGADLGGLSVSAINRLRREGKLIGIKHKSTRQILYPSYQVRDGKIVEPNPSEAFDPGFLVLLTVLKRIGGTKVEALQTLSRTRRFIHESGFPSGRNFDERFTQMSLLAALLDEHYPFNEEDGTSTAEEFGNALGGLSTASVNRMRRGKKLISYKHRRTGRFLYPNFQVKDGKILDGIEACISAFDDTVYSGHLRTIGLRIINPTWNIEGNGYERPIDHLRNGNPERAVQLIKAKIYSLDYGIFI